MIINLSHAKLAAFETLSAQKLSLLFQEVIARLIFTSI